MPLVLAAIPAVGAGLMALVLLFGVVLLVDLLFRSIDVSRIPGIIGNVLKAMLGVLNYVSNLIGGFLASIARPMISIFTVPATAFANVISTVTLAFARIGNAARWLMYNAVPALWNGIFSQIAQVTNNLVALATRLYSQAIHYADSIRALLSSAISSAVMNLVSYGNALHRLAMAALASSVASLTTYALSLFRISTAQLVNAVNGIYGYIVGAYAQLATYAQQLANWAVHTATGISIDWAKKYADQLIDIYNKAIAGGTAIAMAPAWPTVLSAIDSISLALPDSIAAALARIGAIPRAIPRDLALEVGAVAAVSSVAIDWVARCGVSLCRNTKDFGDGLAALEDAALIAAIFELVSEGIANPEQAGRVVHDDITGALGALEHAFSDLVGLGR